ncbi:hypothetical protein VS893_24785, partial [Shigella flexneri]|uniref:hypothetical protein n=1 Tax=Shigella flexneri TaxID=623 RepID=UPI002EA70C59|nr:hypothetical protein [Shigella flexneri]
HWWRCSCRCMLMGRIAGPTVTRVCRDAFLFAIGSLSLVAVFLPLHVDGADCRADCYASLP